MPGRLLFQGMTFFGRLRASCGALAWTYWIVLVSAGVMAPEGPYVLYGAWKTWVILGLLLSALALLIHFVAAFVPALFMPGVRLAMTIVSPLDRTDAIERLEDRLGLRLVTQSSHAAFSEAASTLRKSQGRARMFMRAALFLVLLAILEVVYLSLAHRVQGVVAIDSGSKMSEAENLFEKGQMIPLASPLELQGFDDRFERAQFSFGLMSRGDVFDWEGFRGKWVDRVPSGRAQLVLKVVGGDEREIAIWPGEKTAIERSRPKATVELIEVERGVERMGDFAKLEFCTGKECEMVKLFSNFPNYDVSARKAAPYHLQIVRFSPEVTIIVHLVRDAFIGWLAILCGLAIVLGVLTEGRGREALTVEWSEGKARIRALAVTPERTRELVQSVESALQ